MRLASQPNNGGMYVNKAVYYSHCTRKYRVAETVMHESRDLTLLDTK